MRIAATAADMRRMLVLHRGKHRIALVPTMGCLHAGHLALVRRARELADIVIVSIYVNPLQFGPDEDFAAYPRNFTADAEVCQAAGVDFIFHPEHLHGGAPQVRLAVGELAEVLCGNSRPGHFNGVATVVATLFNIVQPHVAVFGEKDWQQLAIIRRMVADLHFPLEIVGHPTVREADGLAISSRNGYLSPAQRQQAAAVPQALQAMQEAATGGESETSALIHAGNSVLKAAKIKPEYLDIRHAETLQPLVRLSDGPARAFVAARIGKAKLIDNLALE